MFTLVASKLFGIFANTKFPSFIQRRIVRIYIWLFKIDLIEVEGEIDSFPTLNDFFVRNLKEGVREVSNSNLVSPVDGTLIESDYFTGDRALLVKGREYSLSELVGKELNFSSGQFFNFYLSPRDYHHVHAPFDCTLDLIAKIPGALLPVGKFFALIFPRLYLTNKRVVFSGIFEERRFYLVMVGALNVGHIQTIEFIGEVKKGVRIGTFYMGSTVILILEHTKERSIKSSFRKVRFGDEI